MSLTACPRCRSPLDAGENFCGACGNPLRVPAEARREWLDRLRTIAERQRHLQTIRSGRNWILFVAVLQLLGGLLVAAALAHTVNLDLQKTQAARDALTEPERDAFDAQFQRETTQTWGQYSAQRQRLPLVLLAVTGVLFCVYLALWLWARIAPFPAALLALILYSTLLVVAMLTDPLSAAKGWLFHLLIVGGLSKAVASAYRFRRLLDRPAA